MDAISEFLKRIPIPGLKESTERHEIADVITSVTKVPITARQISFKDNILNVSVPPVLKSALHMHKSEIQNQLLEKRIDVKDIK